MLPYFYKSTLRKGGFLYFSKPVEVGISGEAMLCTIVIYFETTLLVQSLIMSAHCPIRILLVASFVFILNSFLR